MPFRRHCRGDVLVILILGASRIAHATQAVLDSSCTDRSSRFQTRRPIALLQRLSSVRSGQQSQAMTKSIAMGKCGLATARALEKYGLDLGRALDVPNTTYNGWTLQEWKQITTSGSFVPVILGFSLLVLTVLTFTDLGSSSDSDEAGNPEVAHPSKLEEWSLLGILALTSYRFYAGFLGATWMPFLLAMEGEQFLQGRQSLFMGITKLIFGLSVLLNPFFGILSDRIAGGRGRRVFILIGVGISGLGIYGCLSAGQVKSLGWYLSGTVLWMVGEGVADVTTETLVPTMLPETQYAISSSLRGLNFLLGGLTGYIMIILMRDWHYSWLYYAYMILMGLCALLSLVFTAQREEISTDRETRPRDAQFCVMLREAYMAPTRYEGGFLKACLCLFIFSCGSAPMFFLLLMIRDLAGLYVDEPLHIHFGLISLVFFISAAAASIVISWSASSANDDRRAFDTAPLEHRQEVHQAMLRWRWISMRWSAISFGVVAVLIPMVAAFPTVSLRITAFYFIGCAFGLAFGSVFCKFQECTWSILPKNVDVANAMGFATMCRLAGVGFGSLAAGSILDVGRKSSDLHHESYNFWAYFVMCVSCATMVFVSAWMLEDVASITMERDKDHD